MNNILVNLLGSPLKCITYILHVIRIELIHTNVGEKNKPYSKKL